MRMMTISKKLGKTIVGLNLAIVIRALRFGIGDAKERLARTFRDIDPFARKNGESMPVSGESLSEDTDNDVPFIDAEWDQTVALSPRDVGPLSYNKVCNVEDFRHPDLLPWIREIYAHEIRRFGPKFPMGFEDRRHWEVAMTVRTFSDHGVLHDRSEVLGVGAGNEPTIFYLTRRVRRVFATDLYLPDGFAWAEADASMLTDPGLNWPFAWNPRRLVAQHMDGRELRHEDESFDGVFSTGSIEHFGTLDQIAQSMREIHRVLKPGGIVALTTEFRVEGPDHGSPGLIFFSPELIQERLIGDLPWRLLSPCDYRLSDLTRKSEVLQSKALEKYTEHITKHKRLLYHKYRQLSYPIIVMKDFPYTFTSVSLSLQKV
jgi:SAM-dependent methyltransferase